MFPASTHSFFMVGRLWAMGVRAEPSLIRTLPGACVSVPSEMRCRHSHSLGTLPWVVPVVSAPSEMRYRYSQVAGYTPGCWAPCPRWCL